MPKSLVLTAPRRLEFAETAARPLAAGEVRLRSLISGISHGTELALYRGTAPFASKAFDTELRVFIPDAGGTFPRQLGYDLVGEAVETGPGVDGVRVGDLIHTGTPHEEEPIIRLDQDGEGYPPVRLPAGSTERGLFVSLASVALQAVHDARIKVGDAVVVSGAGVIGLLAAQLARMNGADPVIVVEPHEQRRRLALDLGAADVVDPTDAGGSVGRRVKTLLRGSGADTAIETSGMYAGLQGAIASVGVGGTVVSAGFYQGRGADLRLGEEWHHNRPTMVSSMGVWGCPHRDHPLWHRQRMMHAVVSLIYSDRLMVDPLLTDTVPFEDAPLAYERLDTDPGSALKIGLAYGTAGRRRQE
jgi:threonine dehydrogenase-like Zn-dependent dehydrogenase